MSINRRITAPRLLPTLSLGLLVLGGCEITSKRLVSVSVIDKATNAPAANLRVRAEYGPPNIFRPAPETAYTSAAGIARIRIPQSDFIYLFVGDPEATDGKYEVIHLREWMIRDGGTLETGHEHYVVALEPVKPEASEDQ